MVGSAPDDSLLVEVCDVPVTSFRSTDRFSWLLGWSIRVAEFGFVQLWVQFLSGVAGIIVIRTLAKDQYALYAIANQMQAVCSMMADIGIGLGVRSIGGRIWQDHRDFGQLVNTALGLRRWFALFSLASIVPLTAWMLWKNGADGVATMLLCGILVLGVVPQLAASVYLIVPQLHGEYRRIQLLDLGNSILRLALIAGFAISRLNAILATAIGAISNWVQLLATRRWASDHVDHNALENTTHRRELIRLSLRLLPNTMFYCFQGQITLLILTLVGNRNGIADIAALGRLAILLTVFSSAFTNVLVPRFARCQDPSRLRNLYVALIGGVTLVLLPIVVVAWLLPAPLLFLLGEKYKSLHEECGWIVTIACTNLLAGMMANLNGSRAWIHYGSVAYIPVVLITEAVSAMILDLTRFQELLYFTLIAAVAPFPLLIADAVRGLIGQKPQE